MGLMDAVTGLFGFALLYGLFLAVWLWLHIEAFAYVLFTKDAKWKKGSCPSKLKPDDDREDRIKLVFIRHGESTWNDTFNRSKNPVFFIPRLIFAAFQEISLLLGGTQDSWFLDSPLSTTGLGQAEDLKDFLQKESEKTGLAAEQAKMLLGKSSERSTLVSSNLRRAISTAVVGLNDRIAGASHEKIIIHSALQECSRNVDTLSITPRRSNPEPSWIDRDHRATNIADAYKSKLDPALHTGNKSAAITGQDRLLAFNEWAFGLDEPGVLICTGHSLWFKAYFKEFLPESEDPPFKCTTKKMFNCSVVSLEVIRFFSDGKPVYKIDAPTVSTIYRGFMK